MKLVVGRKILAVGVVLAAVGFWVWRSDKKGGEERTVQVVRESLVETLTLSGKVTAETKATLTFLSPGKLSFVRFRPGDRVQRGEWIAGVDTGDLKAAERSAYYAYLAADANAKLVEDSLKGKDGTENFGEKNSRVAAQTARDRAYDNWLVAQRAVANAVLRAPFAGVIAEITVSSPGDIVGVTDGVTIVDPETLVFESEVNESDLAKVAVGQEAVIKLDAYPDREFRGVVKRMGFSTRTGETGATVVPVWISLPGENDLFRQGLNGDASLILGVANNALVLPVEAVVEGEVVMADGSKRKVKIGRESEFKVEILEGLNEGDRVVIK